MEFPKSDITLILELRANNKDVFDEIYKRYAPLLLLAATAILKDKAAAMDVVQDVFAKLWEKRAGFFHYGELKPYLMRTIKNRCIDIIRREDLFTSYNRAQRAILPAETSEPILDKDEKYLLYDAIEKLPPQQRKVFKLKYCEDYSPNEIAAETGKSIQTIKNLLGDAKKGLRKKLIYLHDN